MTDVLKIKVNGVWTSIPAIKGEPGTGIVSITKTSTSGFIDTYTITYSNGTTSTFNISNGQDGYSPTANVSKSGNISTITITDKNGTTTARVYDGIGNVSDVTVNGTTVLDGTIAKIVVPTKTSDITNDSGYIDNTYHDSTKYDASNPNGYTSNVGTITGINMNGSSKGTSGVVDLGTVITSHQDISGKLDKNNTIIGATKCKITYDSKGLVTGGANLSVSDIPNLTLAKITDVTATASEINILDGITATTTELNYTDGVTSNIQTQLNGKQPTGNYVAYTNNTATIAGTSKTVSKTSPECLFVNNGLIMGGSAASAGLVTRGICGVATPNNTTGACTKDNLYLNYDGNDTNNPNGRGIVINAGYVGTDLGSGMYSYCATRGDVVKTWVEAKGYTSNIGTITGITMNGSSKGTSGVVDLGTVITAHQSLDNCVKTSGNQTIAGTKTFTGNPIFSGTTDIITVKTSTSVSSPSIKFETSSSRLGRIGVQASTGNPIFWNASDTVANILRNSTLNTAVGSTTQPVYIDANGVATACNTMCDLVSAQTISGVKTFSSTISGNISGSSSSCTGNASTATTLQTTRTINGTNFNGSANITTANWGTARNVGIVNSDGTGTAVTTSVNGSTNVNLKLPATIKANLTGNADTATKATQDADGNVITSTYVTTSELLSVFSSLYPVGSIYLTTSTSTSCPITNLIPGSTWELVSQDRVLQGAGDRGTVGSTLAESLPNIKGSIACRSAWSTSASDGAFSSSEDRNDADKETGSSSWRGLYSFNASNSSSVYQDNAHVQPSAYLVNVWRRTA